MRGLQGEGRGREPSTHLGWRKEHYIQNCQERLSSDSALSSLSLGYLIGKVKIEFCLFHRAVVKIQ